jgi:hypothetical protein
LSPEIVLLFLVLIWKRASSDDAACVGPGAETGGVAFKSMGPSCSMLVQ